VLPVADDDSCEIKVNGGKPGTVTALNVGATFVRLEVKSADGSNSQVNLCLLLARPLVTPIQRPFFQDNLGKPVLERQNHYGF